MHVRPNFRRRKRRKKQSKQRLQEKRRLLEKKKKKQKLPAKKPMKLKKSRYQRWRYPVWTEAQNRGSSALRDTAARHEPRHFHDSRWRERQDETEVQNDGLNDNVDEDKVDSLNDFRDENDEGFREDNIDNDEDVEEDREPGRDMKPEPPPQPPLYRPSRPPIKLSFLGTTSFELRTSKGLFGVV